ncbi:MAG: NYN domain-containing protein [Anaerolineae bacterium]|jgi:hypothetical protein|nr:NYN domain-containing protein [Anaerolineae bacterium]
MTPVINSGDQTRRIAMLIDGDNAQPSLIEKMLAETAKYGLTTIRRIYGDWTAANMGGWKDMLQTYAIQPIQQFRYTIGKNATDSAMIIDAMDILYTGGVDGFCLVSSDSDYTRLATRIREKGFYVMGIGKKNTPRAFVNACDVFTYTENLLPESQRPKPSTRRKKGTTAPAEPVTPDPLPLLKNAFEIASQEDGWAFLGTLGHHVRQLDPGFDSRTYGYKQLSVLIRSMPKNFELKEVKSEDGTAVIYVRMKE